MAVLAAFSWDRNLVIKSWVGLWSIQSIPSVTSLNPTGSHAGLGKCGRTWGGGDLSAKFLAAFREWQFVIKCSAFSGPRPHSLQVGSPLDLPWVRYLKWLASCSKISQPVRRRIRKLVRLVAFVSPSVTDQWWVGRPIGIEHAPMWRSVQSSIRDRYVLNFRSFLVELWMTWCKGVTGKLLNALNRPFERSTTDLGTSDLSVNYYLITRRM